MTERDWWEEQFELSVRYDVIWLRKAEGLKRAADVLYPMYEQASQQLLDLESSPLGADEASSRLASEEEVGLLLDTRLGPVWQMLMGLAIENLAKGLLVSEIVSNGSGPIDENGAFKFKSHNLLELVGKCVNLTDVEERILRGLATHVTWRGRYPAPGKRSQMFDEVRVEPGPGSSVVPGGPEYGRSFHDAVEAIYGRLFRLLSAEYAARIGSWAPFNSLADEITKLIRVLGSLAGTDPEEWAAERDLSRYFGPGFKGEAAVKLDSKMTRRQFLAGVVADADRLIGEAREARGRYPHWSIEDQQIAGASQLLGQLCMQDVERRVDGVDRATE